MCAPGGRSISGAVLMALGTVVLAIGCQRWTAYEDARDERARWPTVAGTSLSVGRSDLQDLGDNVDLTVAFEYEVSGIAYRGRQTFSVGEEGPFADRAHETDARQKYARGRVVTVYYQPGNPVNAVVEPEPIPPTGDLAALMIPIYAGMALVGWGGWRVVRRSALPDGASAPPSLLPNRH